jgi:hypothetical protein
MRIVQAARGRAARTLQLQQLTLSFREHGLGCHPPGLVLMGQLDRLDERLL